MKTITIMDTITDTELTVNEMTRKEALAQVIEWIENLRFAAELVETNSPFACDPDQYIFIEYNDGTTYSHSYCDEEGKFKKTGIKYIEMNDGYEYYISGKYEMNEETNFIPQAI